ncbi:MAG: CDP-diacylglycerol--glycerol-3-phosphate 3-phosphatidyltransferase [Oscillospiraceae bacterium]|jgi:CDP-diacylglycerol--glycerol-3-phosphate 3-phosphatidyltransferase|nr:CDP-diacylglycerol--glycerol-3-phosphate 3-phosphatidyltransferase [Oscillospiraceae bacterium]
MNLANKLTVVRVALIPVFLFFFFASFIPWHYLWAFVVFSAASVTDTLDGQIARKRGLVTDFGKLMDPLADKLLVMSAVVCLIPVGIVHAVVVIVILAREFVVTAIRQIAAANGTVIAADKWGKIKTVFQMIWLGYEMLYLFVTANLGLQMGALALPLAVIHYILLAGVLVFTVFSGLNYLIGNRALFSDM